MKTAILALLSIISINTYAQNPEYMTNPDGSSQYIGNCALHMDYEGRGITVGEELVETFEFYSFDENESMEFYYSLTPLARQLMLLTGGEEGFASEYNWELVNYFDDFSAFEIKLDLWGAPKSKLTVVSYGVGGGNGGYMFFEKNNDEYKLVASSFDGDILQCDDRYKFETELY